MGACPVCGQRNDAATDVSAGDVRMPKAGDVSLCFNCGGLSTFTGDGLEVRHPSKAELQAYLRDPQVTAYQAAVRADIAARGRDHG